MSLVIGRRPGESFVLIDKRRENQYVLVRIEYNNKVVIDAPDNVHILRREILHEYPQYDSVRAEIERIEGAT